MPHLSSMTAFAQASATNNGYQMSCELRSVNHRYLEPQFRLPEALRATEPLLRELLRNHLKRGKVDVTLKLELAPASQALQLNNTLLTHLVGAAKDVQDQVPDATAPSALDLLRWPGMLEESHVDQKLATQSATELFEVALERLINARASEGHRLQALLLQQLTTVEGIVDDVRPQSENIMRLQQQRLHLRLQELEIKADPARLEQEVALLAQRSDIREELDRLMIHVAEARKLINEPGPHGRRLDFLSQELNREANTLGAKATQTDVSQKAIDLKVVIEQIREQVQNVE